MHLARTLVELNRIAEALIETERALAGNPGPEVRFQAGRLLRDLAERRFAQLQSAAPGSAATIELAGARFERAGDVDEALKHYRAVVSLDASRPGAHYLVGNILWRKQELDAAADALRKELTLNPHHGLANLRMGQVLARANRHAEALPYLERALFALPQSTDARRELGKSYRSTGRLREARTHWEKVAKARPNDDQVHYLLGNLYRELGEEALAKLELAAHRAILERRRVRAEEQQR
jgi:tetratricopeptide (TPR) repeat protein